MTIGGFASGDYRDETYIVDTTTNIWTPGPKLNKARSDHACAKVTLGDKQFVVVTGGVGAEISVEYLDTTDMDEGWKSGKLFFLG